MLLYVQSQIPLRTKLLFSPYLYTHTHTRTPTHTPKNFTYMDNKVTLSFDKEVIRLAKEYAASQNISLSRLVELLLRKTTMEQYRSLEEIPIASWVREVSEGPMEYRARKRSRKDSKDEFFSSKK